jgi:hypothetical protein
MQAQKMLKSGLPLIVASSEAYYKWSDAKSFDNEEVTSNANSNSHHVESVRAHLFILL